ncbi:MAG: S-adenosyl-l-methionine hydroxide adenosyltransferase family protein [Phycisphaerae bacterium]
MSNRMACGAPRGAALIGCAALAGALPLLAWPGCAAPGRNYVGVLTDYGTRDHYAAVLTASILRANPEARIVPITHDIEPYNVVQGAFVLSEAVPAFPPGAVVLGIVDPGGTARNPIVAVTQAGHLLVGPDNGLFDLLLRREGASAVYLLERVDLVVSNREEGPPRDVFGPVAGYLSRGHGPETLGPRLDRWTRVDLAEPARENGVLHGAVLHVDRFGNLLTNLPGAWLKEHAVGTCFTVERVHRAPGAQPLARAQCSRQRTYGDVPAGEYVAIEGASQQVEIARNQGDAAAALGIEVGDEIVLQPLAE